MIVLLSHIRSLYGSADLIRDSLGTVYDDAPHTYSDGTAIRNASGTYGGRTTLRQGIVKSLNVLALKCFQEMGTDTVYDRLKQFGFDHLTEAER